MAIVHPLESAIRKMTGRLVETTVQHARAQYGSPDERRLYRKQHRQWVAVSRLVSALADVAVATDADLQARAKARPSPGNGGTGR